MEVDDLAGWVAGADLSSSASTIIDRLKTSINTALAALSGPYNSIDSDESMRLVKVAEDIWLVVLQDGRTMEIKLQDNGDLHVSTVTIKSLAFAASIGGVSEWKDEHRGQWGRGLR